MIYTETVEIDFEWDPKKAESNLAKHGVSFDQAIFVFDDPFALIVIDEQHSTAMELREWIIGEMSNGILMAVFTRRAEGLVRLIGARRANQEEREKYEFHKTVSV